MTNTVKQGKHTNHYVSTDGCTNRDHGLGLGVCRIHLNADRCGRYVGKHAAR